MIWVLDTNVISELRRPKPNKRVTDWVSQQNSDDIWTCRICLVEIQSGIAMRATDDLSVELQHWYNGIVMPMFENKLFDISDETLMEWLAILRSFKAQRLPAPPVDLLIAATCKSIGCGIATRDTKPFATCGIQTFNPFTGEHFNQKIKARR